MTRPMYGGRGGTDIVRWYKQKLEAVEEGNSNAISDAASEGERLMKHYIATRGTAKSGKQGRIETGRMFSAVTSSFNRTARGNAVGRFGWLKDRADYFRYQEGGFEHYQGIDVPGMYAMTDAQEEVVAMLKDDIRKNLHGA